MDPISTVALFSSIYKTQFIYWAMDEKAATQLQGKGLRFYFNLLVESQSNPSYPADDAKGKLRLWK